MRNPEEGTLAELGESTVFQQFWLKRPARGAARLLPETAPIPPIETTKDPDLQAKSKTGATGLEPATSGVTGQFERHDPRRRSARSRSIHAAFWALRGPIPRG
jgi:hypothetical protein